MIHLTIVSGVRTFMKVQLTNQLIFKDMTLYYSDDNFEVLAFYTYPSVVLNRMSEYTELFGQKGGVRHVKQMFDGILKKAEAMKGKRLMDNKIAFKVLYVPTNTILYIGYKDNTWSVGLSVNQEYNKEITL